MLPVHSSHLCFSSHHFPQMSVYYYPSGQYPTSTTQQYRPLASVQYSAQRSQQIPQTAQQAGTWNLFPFCSLAWLFLMVNFIDVLIGWVPKRDNLSHMFFLPREANKAIDSLCGKLTGTRRRQGVCLPMHAQLLPTSYSYILWVYFQAARQVLPYLPSLCILASFSI